MIEILQLLHEQSASLPAYCGSYYIRTLKPDEPLPDLGQEIPDNPLVQKDWIWLAYDRYTDKPLAMLVTAPAHGLVVLLRIYAIKSARKSILTGLLLRKSLAAIANRGYTRYVTFLDEGRETEAALIDIAKRAGATSTGKHVMVSGPTAIKW